MYFEISMPERILITSKSQFETLVNKYNGIKNLAMSVYKYDKLNGQGKIDYNSLKLDKVFFDFDEDAFKNMEKLHDYLKKNNIKHKVRLSGKGYHVYIYLKDFKCYSPKQTLRNLHDYFEEKAGINYDKAHIRGNVAQQARIKNTKNLKVNRFCVDLNEELIKKGDEFIKKYASIQRHNNFFIGNDLYFPNGEIDNSFQNEVELAELPDNFKDNIKGISKNMLKYFPDCICGFLYKLKELNKSHKQRLWLITFLKEFGLSERETEEILSKFLSRRKLCHCLQKEKQVYHVYHPDRHKYHFPCKEIRMMGYCPNEKCCDLIRLMYHYKNKKPFE